MFKLMNVTTHATIISVESSTEVKDCWFSEDGSKVYLGNFQIYNCTQSPI